MVDPIAFEAWVQETLVGENGLHPSSQLQVELSDAVMRAEITIMSRAISWTGVDETQARMTLAIVHAFERSLGGGANPSQTP